MHHHSYMYTVDIVTAKLSLCASRPAKALVLWRHETQNPILQTWPPLRKPQAWEERQQQPMLQRMQEAYPYERGSRRPDAFASSSTKWPCPGAGWVSAKTKERWMHARKRTEVRRQSSHRAAASWSSLCSKSPSRAPSTGQKNWWENPENTRVLREGPPV